jgi:hypothetical protein
VGRFGGRKAPARLVGRHGDEHKTPA